jgi:hypothetical protein
MRPVHLTEDTSRLDKQHVVVPLSRGLILVEEPQRAGVCYGIEEVRPYRYDDIDRAALDQLFTNFELGAPCVTGRIGHHEASAPPWSEGGIE